MNMINENDLEKVTGGTTEYEDLRKEEFENAWGSLRMEEKGYTGTELEDLFTQWQKDGYKPDAVAFLQTCKTL